MGGKWTAQADGSPAAYRKAHRNTPHSIAPRSTHCIAKHSAQQSTARAHALTFRMNLKSQCGEAGSVFSTSPRAVRYVRQPPATWAR